MTADALMISLSVAALFVLGLVIGSYISRDHLKDEAFDRGFMSECLGKTGYHWECDE